MALSRTISGIKGGICKIVPPLYFTPRNGAGSQRTRMMPLPEHQKCVTICPFFWTQYRRNNIALACIA